MKVRCRTVDNVLVEVEGVRRHIARRAEEIFRARGDAYLAYINRSQVDMLRGFFGGFVRVVFEDRVERQAPLIVRGLRARLESGHPPDEVSDPFTNERPGAH
jgi:hypothetical protein